MFNKNVWLKVVKDVLKELGADASGDAITEQLAKTATSHAHRIEKAAKLMGERVPMYPMRHYKDDKVTKARFENATDSYKRLSVLAFKLVTFAHTNPEVNRQLSGSASYALLEVEDVGFRSMSDESILEVHQAQIDGKWHPLLNQERRLARSQ